MSGLHTDAAGGVRRRHVLFFGGFDPKGASWYHALYQRHAALQAAVNGMRIDVGKRQRDAAGNQFWMVRGRDADGRECESRVEVIGWDAIVRRYWPRTGLRVLGDMLAAYARMLWHGPRQVAKVGRIAPRTLFALCYPLLFLADGALLGLATAAAGAWLALLLGAARWQALALAALLLGAAMWGVLRLERRLETSLLARIFAFVSRYAVHGVPELDAVIALGARRITQLLREGECDELLVAGYSVGTILVTRATAQALAEAERTPASRPALALLTLGNCIPLLGLFPQAGAYRAELARIAQSDRLRWVDVSSPIDWGSFPLLDPIEVCEIGLHSRGEGSPQMTSPRFHTLMQPARYAAMIRDKHAIHTQYLASTDLPGLYDWFAITAGPLPLAQRYVQAGRRRAPRATGEAGA